MKTTHVVFVIDRSGSMSSTAEEAVNNYNDQVRLFKKMAEETAGTAEVKVSLITFATEVFEHLWEVPASDLQECKQGDFNADGWTAMLDGIGYSIEKLRETTNYNDPDNNYIFVIVTDGQENKSSHYKWVQEHLTEAQIKDGQKPDPRLPLDELMKPLEASGRWTFSFMGCDRHYLTEAAAALNVPMANVALWDNKTVKGARTGHRNSSKRVYAAALNMVRGIGGSSCKNMYSDSECLADYASADSADLDKSIDVDTPAVSCSVGGAAVFSTGAKAAWKS